MAIHPHCDMCKKELTDFGGLIFSPPQSQGKGKPSVTEKYHMCKACWEELKKMLK